MELFTALNDEGVTVIVVTHEDEIAAFTKRVIRFRDGAMISDKLQQPKLIETVRFVVKDGEEDAVI
jgi:putative ABC transport system ATP-binding protein